MHQRLQTYTQIWMLSKSAASMIIAISMGQEICLIIGRVFTQEEKPSNGYMWSGWRLTRKQLTSRPYSLWPELWIKLGRNAKLQENKDGPMKNQNSQMLEDYEEFISLTLRRTRKSKRPSRMLARNWKHQWLPLCLARQARTVSMW